ncbi:cytochrome P450 [Xylaria sp. FL0043]|nr:cytochrome P450 [Xylaria sp. FL0043]
MDSLINTTVEPGENFASNYTLSNMAMCSFILMVVAWVAASLARKPGKGVLMTANRSFYFEPSLFARLRWCFGARGILEAADQKVCSKMKIKSEYSSYLHLFPSVLRLTWAVKAGGRPYLLARGDKDLVVLPASLIPEMNRMSADVLNSRQSHAFTLLGGLTGMTVVEKTSYHVRMLLGRISPALPELFPGTATRISSAISREFTSCDDWTVFKPLPATVRCFSEGIALALFGAKMSENSRLVELTHELTTNVFQVAFIMRCVPSVLQPLCVWLLPAKWRMESNWRELGDFVKPAVRSQADLYAKNSPQEIEPNLISWMVKDGRTALERDPDVLTTLCGSVAAGSTYSIANFVCRALVDLVAHPGVLNAVRAEIRSKGESIGGVWDLAAVSDLEKLDSAMKETARLAPGTIIVYSRVVQQECILAGIKLEKGQFITTSGPSRALDPAIFENPKEYQGLRFCAEDNIERHRARPFRSVDTDILTWGAGRWACPGRLVADMAAKILLVKLLDEWDFAFVNGKPLSPNAVHEFMFFHPDNRMLARRRADRVGVKFS